MELIDAVRDVNVVKVKDLVESHACNINYRDGNSRTCLMWAVRSGSVELVTVLLNAGAPIDAKDLKGRTALTWAAECGRTDIVHVLLNNGAEFRASNELGPTALSWSAWRGHVDVVRVLLQFGADKNAQDNYGCTALVNACINDKLAVIEELLHQKADPNIADDFARCPIGIAVEHANYKIAKLLCKAGADLQVFLPNEETLLHWASFRGNIEMAKLLLDFGANVNHPNKTDLATPLIAAVANGHINISKLLLDRGANIFCVDSLQRDAFRWAYEMGQVQAVKMLLDAGADVFKCYEDGRTAFIWSAETDNIDLLSVLLQASAFQSRLHEKAEERETVEMAALSCAALIGNWEITCTLVNAGSGTAQRLQRAKTAAIWAAGSGHTDTVVAICSELPQEDNDASLLQQSDITNQTTTSSSNNNNNRGEPLELQKAEEDISIATNSALDVIQVDMAQAKAAEENVIAKQLDSENDQNRENMKDSDDRENNHDSTIAVTTATPIERNSNRFSTDNAYDDDDLTRSSMFAHVSRVVRPIFGKQTCDDIILLLRMNSSESSSTAVDRFSDTHEEKANWGWKRKNTPRDPVLDPSMEQCVIS